MHIIALGDSLTYGYDVPAASGWLARISRRQPEWRIHNFGICGDSLAGICRRLRPALRVQKADLIFLMGGTNDLLTQADLYGKGFEENFCQPLLEATRFLRENHLPYLIGAPPLIFHDSVYTGWQTEPAWSISRQALTDYAAALENHFPERVIHFCDILDHAALFDDGVHPNIEGYRLMAEHALPYFERCLS